MPIEDVDYLKQNSTVQNYIFLVDSADRNRTAYPDPSEYVVEFPTPFANVIGMEVLDASVPRTMYNVDVINNKIRFYIGAAGAAAPGAYHTATVDIGEYTIQTLIPKLNAALQMSPDNNPELPVVAITAQSLSSPPDVRNTITFSCPYPFYFNMDPVESTMAETLGFDLLAAPGAEGYTIPVPANRRIFGSVDKPIGEALGPATTLFEGPRGVLRRASGLIAQRFTTNATRWLTQISVALYNQTNAAAVGYTIRQGSATGTILYTGQIPITYIDGGLSADLLEVPLSIQPNVNYWLVVDTAGSDTGVFYNDVLGATGPTFLINGASIDSGDIKYQMSALIIANDEYHALTAPGIYSLIGPRYIILRCPEIEEHSFRSLAYTKHFLGFAKIKLGVIGYSDVRLDYSKVPMREFHPIGKLSRITIRFTLPDGSLYDFKGVNHTITLAIKYLEPVQKQCFARSLINPNYTGNIMEYMFHQEAQELDSDDADDAAPDPETERADAALAAAYRQHELMYLPENVRQRDLQMIQELIKSPVGPDSL